MHEQSNSLQREYNAAMGQELEVGSAPIELMPKKRMREMHSMGARYLNQYVSQNKKDINGSEFSVLVEQLRLAKIQGFIAEYDTRLLERLV